MASFSFLGPAHASSPGPLPIFVHVPDVSVVSQDHIRDGIFLSFYSFLILFPFFVSGEGGRLRYASPMMLSWVSSSPFDVFAYFLSETADDI